MDLTSSVVIAGVCKYTSELFGVSKSITSSMIHHANTFHIEDVIKCYMSIFSHSRFQQGRHIDSLAESKYKFTKVRTLVIHPSVSGGQLKNIKLFMKTLSIRLYSIYAYFLSKKYTFTVYACA